MKTYGAVVRLPAGRDPVARITATPELAESQAPIRSLALTLQPDATPVPRDFSLPVPYPTPVLADVRLFAAESRLENHRLGQGLPPDLLTGRGGTNADFGSPTAHSLRTC